MKQSSNRWLRAVVLISLLGLLNLANANEPKPSAAVTNPFAGQENVIPTGKTQFNVHCSHCHGPNAIQGERRRDLRRLSRRYRDRMPAVFYKTVTTGRPEKGMPSWQGKLEEEVLWKIFTFLETVQK